MSSHSNCKYFDKYKNYSKVTSFYTPSAIIVACINYGFILMNGIKFYLNYSIETGFSPSINKFNFTFLCFILKYELSFSATAPIAWNSENAR